MLKHQAAACSRALVAPSIHQRHRVSMQRGNRARLAAVVLHALPFTNQTIHTCHKTQRVIGAQRPEGVALT